MKQALERRLGILFGSGVVVLFLLGALQNQSIIKLTTAIRGVTASHQSLENLARLDSLVSGAALEADSYAMTGDATHLQGYRKAAAEVPGILRRLQPPKAENPEPSQEWAALGSQTSAALTELQKMTEGRTTNQHSSATPLMASHQAVDGARQAIQQVQEKERRRLKQRNGAVTADSRLATASTALGAALALWLLIVASLVIHRYVAERRSSQGTRVLAMEVLRSLDQAVYLADETGMVLYANAAADAMFGYEPGKLVGTDVIKLNDLSRSESGPDLGLQIDAGLMRGAAWTGKLMSYKKDRSAFLSSARVTALELSGKSYWLFAQNGVVEPGSHDDSTEMPQATQMLEPSEPLSVEPVGR